MNWEEHYDTKPLEGELSDFDEVAITRVDDAAREGLWNHVVQEHHPFGYEGVAGRRMKYLVALDNKLVGAISFCAASYTLGPRDIYVGWDEKTRLDYLPHLLNNNVFLIFPWINVKNLASHLLNASLKKLKDDWKAKYDLEPYMIETFVDRETRLGSSYSAANWIHLGISKGLGKADNSFLFQGRDKDIYVTVTNRRFAKIFRPDISRLAGVKDEITRLLKEVPLNCPSVLKAVGAEGASSESIAAPLSDHIERYAPFLGRKEHLLHMVAMIKGRLSELKRKTPEPIASTFEGKEEVRNFLNFMSRSLFDESGMLLEFQKDLSSILSHPEGMITAEEVNFHKKGKSSVGVARQFSNILGKRDNFQASVMTGYASPLGKSLSDFSLFMPPEWFEEDHAYLRQKCHVPGDMEFKTKEELFSRMILKILDSGLFSVKYIGLTPSFGTNDLLLDSLPKDLIKFAEVPSAHTAFIKDLKGSEEFRLVTVKDAALDPSLPWLVIPSSREKKGTTTPLYRDRLLKVRKSRSGILGEELWLYLRTYEDGTEKFALLDEMPNDSPESLALPASLRWSMGDCIKECTELLGMNHYEVRTLKAWRRQMLFTLISHLFVNKLRQGFSAAYFKPEELVAL
jgi:hypothetical protein